MKKIYPIEWLKLHPYKQANSIDQYYVGIANRIYEKLCFTGPFDLFEDDDDRCNTSLCLAAWFEDIISQTGIWQTFTAECKKQYGAYLPFYPINNTYFPDEINLEDIRFLIWHHMQYLCSKLSVLDPENIEIEKVAQNIYELLSVEYETAPENERMQKYLCHSTMGEEDFALYVKTLEWFHYHCYFNIGNLDQYFKESDEIANHEQVTNENKHAILYGVYVSLTLNGRKNLLALTSPEWLALLGNRHSANKLWSNTKALKSSCYLLEKEDEEYLYLRDMCNAEELFNVKKKSFILANIKNRKVGESAFICELVHYGNTCWQYGTLIVNGVNKNIEDYVNDLKKTTERVNERAEFHNFMKASGGKFFVFVDSQKEAEKFLIEKMGYSTKEVLKLLNIPVKEKLIFTATPQIGLRIEAGLCDYIYSDDNPFYNKEKAEESAISLMLNSEMLPYELSCILQDNNMLPDACLNKRVEQEYERKFLHANANFLTDYFHHRCRKNDFCDKDLLKYINK